MTVLVVDDELAARSRLVRLLRSIPHVELAGEAGNGIEALDAIESRDPDVVLLDVQMPEMDGFEVAEQLAGRLKPCVIFITAYEQYALRAFEVSAVDYLLKPVEQERLSRALAKANTRLGTEGSQDSLTTLAHVLPPRFLARLVGKRLGKFHLLPCTEIISIEASDELLFAVTASGRFLLTATLRDLEARLDPAVFQRVHKSALLNLSAIIELEPLPNGNTIARLRDGRTAEISRRYRAGLKRVLDW